MNRKPFPRELRRFFVLAATCIRVSWSLFIFPRPPAEKWPHKWPLSCCGCRQIARNKWPPAIFYASWGRRGGCFDNPPLRRFNDAQRKDFFVCISNNLFILLLPFFPFLTLFFLFQGLFFRVIRKGWMRVILRVINIRRCNSFFEKRLTRCWPGIARVRLFVRIRDGNFRALTTLFLSGNNNISSSQFNCQFSRYNINFRTTEGNK